MRRKATNAKLSVINILLIIVFIVVMWMLITVHNNNNKFKETLLKDWTRIEHDDAGTYYELELDFSEDTIKYNFNSVYSWLNTTIAEYKYKVLTNSKIQIDNKIYKIEFNDDKTMMIITPSLTDSTSSENWFHHD